MTTTRIVFSIVGTMEQHPNVEVHLPSVPREGETVKIPGVPEANTTVRTVVWYPLADDEEEPAEPFVYVVLGHRRPYQEGQ